MSQTLQRPSNFAERTAASARKGEARFEGYRGENDLTPEQIDHASSYSTHAMLWETIAEGHKLFPDDEELRQLAVS